MNVLKTIRNENVGLTPVKPFVLARERIAVRAVLLMGERVVLMYSTRDNYFKLPGGGVKSDEDIQTALAREILEETGFTAKVTKQIGTIIEERGDEGFRQKSEAFIAEQYGEKSEPMLTDSELAAGFVVYIADDIDHAIALVEDAHPENGGGLFMKARDGEFLRKAKTLLAK